MQENTKGQQDQEQQEKGLHEERSQAQGAGGSNSDHNNASAVRGGTTDMDHASTHTGSGLGSKTTVTGSDFDGQVTGR